MKDLLKLIGIATLAVTGLIATILLIAGIALALMSPLILIVWLIIQAL